MLRHMSYVYLLILDVGEKERLIKRIEERLNGRRILVQSCAFFNGKAATSFAKNSFLA